MFSNETHIGIWIALLASCASGCGGGEDRLPLFPASGVVLADGKPADGVEVRLVPADAIDDRDALRPFATTGADGAFALGTYEKGDGAPAGRYKVTLFQPDQPPGPGHPNDLLGGQFADAAKSPLEATIAEGPNTLKPFEVRTADASSQAPAGPKTQDLDFPE
jgi:hypothetical protein